MSRREALIVLAMVLLTLRTPLAGVRGGIKLVD